MGRWVGGKRKKLYISSCNVEISSNGNVSPDTPELTKTMDPQRQKENIANLKAMGIPEVSLDVELLVNQH